MKRASVVSSLRASSASAARRLKRRPSSIEIGGGSLDRRGRDGRATAGLFQSRRGGSRASAAETPAIGGEAVARPRDRDDARSRHDLVERGFPSALDDDGRPHEVVEQDVDSGVAAAHMGPHTVGTETVSGRRRRQRAESQHGARGVALMKRPERAPRRVAIAHDDGYQRLPRRGLERRFPSVVDLDQIEEGAEHPVDTGEAGDTGARSGLLERKGQRIGPGFPSAELRDE